MSQWWQEPNDIFFCFFGGKYQFLPFSSRKKWQESWQEPSSNYPQLNAAFKNPLSAEMKQKYMKMFLTVKCAKNLCHKITNVENSLDVSRSAWNNEGKGFIFVAFHDFKQLCSLCFAGQSKECSIAKNEARPADPTKQCFLLPPLASHFSTKHKLTVSFQLFFFNFFPFSFVFATTILSPRRKYRGKPLTIAESQIEYFPC